MTLGLSFLAYRVELIVADGPAGAVGGLHQLMQVKHARSAGGSVAQT